MMYHPATTARLMQEQTHIIKRITKMNLTEEQIAQVCHETNRAFCAVIGDTSQPSWADAPVWQIESAVAGVKAHLGNPDMSPKDSHNAWFDHKVADGWTWGPVKDADLKQHPCMVPYDSLPDEQKMKDFLFKNVIHTLKYSV